MNLKISHRTSYHYEEPVSYALQQLRMTPTSGPTQQVREWNIHIGGGSEELRFDDHFGNRVILISFKPDDHEISVVCEGEVEVSDTSGVVGKHTGFVPLWLYRRSTTLTHQGAGIRKLLSELPDPGENNIEFLHALATLIASRIRYLTGHTDTGTSAEAALEAGHGVCQDHAHVYVSAARLAGFPARYVSGYLLMDEGTDQDASHAWAEVHVAGVGWVGFDVPNGISPDERYVRVASGLDYSDVAPISGIRYGKGRETMSVDIQVQQ